MKSVKWMYVSAMAIAFGMLSFATVACHDDDDDPKPAEGEVIETPKPVVEYYIKGAVTVKGEGKSGVKVKVGDKDCITDSKGEFSVTESNTGTYEVSVAPNGYLSQKTSVKIADNAENRSVVKVAFALTEVSPVKEVVLDEMTDPITVEDESTSNEAIPTTTEDFGQVEPDKVVEDCITDSKGEFSVTESNTGTYEVSVAPNGYLSQKTSVKIADNAENRSVVKVAFALTEVSPVKEVVLDEMTDPITVEDESTSNEAIPTTTEDFGQVEPDKVVEDMPLAKVEIVIPAGVIKEDAQEDPTLVKNGKVDISVTTFVPAPKEVVTEVKPTEVVEAVKSIPLAAAQFQPTGLQFSEPVNISIPNPIPGVTFPKATMQLSYLNPDNGEWEVQAAEVTVGEANYKAPVTHFSAYAIENQVNSKVEKEVIQKDEILGQESRDNSENAKALTGIVLKYKEKTGWDYEKGRGVVEAIKEALGSSVPENTLNAMAAYLKTRMYSLMGTTSGVTETERTYNTVNVNGYTEMNYTCYAKTRKTTLSTTVVYGGSEKTISVSAIRYTGADQQYKTVTYNPTHSGGKGGSI